MTRRAIRTYAALAAWAVLLVPVTDALAKPRYTQGGGVEPNGRISLTPDKYERDVVPGEASRIPIMVFNKTDHTVTAQVSVTDLEPSDAENSLIQITPDGKYGAKEWLEPELDTITLKSLQTVEFDVIVTPPLGAPVGTNFAGLRLDITGRGNGNARVESKITAVSQLYLTVPGEVQRDTRITAATVADSFIFHGSGFVTYEAEVHNGGNVNDHVKGEIVVRSMFGNTVTTLDIKPYLVLRDSTRTIRAIWANPPLFGRFSAEVRLETDSGRLKKDLPAVTVSPPWWWYAIILVVVLLPIAWYVRQRRNSWKQYLDEDWDDEFEDDSDYETSV